jgi:hypothetical protein
MTEVTQVETTEVAVRPAKGMPGSLVSLPLVGPTTIEDVAFYGVLGVVTVVKLVSWPTAALIGSAHILHQRARNLALSGHERGELIEGTLEATGELI